MKRVEAESIGDVLRRVVDEADTSERIFEARAAESFRAIVGDYVASRCRRPTLRRGVMTVGVADASLRQELTMNRTGLAAAVNAAAGRKIVVQMRFTS